jgi:hypothetical protein
MAMPMTLLRFEPYSQVRRLGKATSHDTAHAPGQCAKKALPALIPVATAETIADIIRDRTNGIRSLE